MFLSLSKACWVLKSGITDGNFSERRGLGKVERSNWGTIVMVYYRFSYLVRRGCGVIVSGDTDIVALDVMDSLVNAPIIDRSLLSNLFVSVLSLPFKYVTYACFI